MKGLPVASFDSPAQALDRIRAFERRVGEMHGADWSLSVCNCTSGLFAALIALGVRPRAEVIVPSMSWDQTWFPVIALGAVPVVVDLRPDWPVMDAAALRRALRAHPSAKAVVTVGLWGSPVGLKEIHDVCVDHRVPLVIDAAQLFGARINGRGIAAVGDLVILSFGSLKDFSCGEGGMILGRGGRRLRDRLLALTQHPFRVHSEAQDLGLVPRAAGGACFNFRLHPAAAVLGLGLLDRYDAAAKRAPREIEDLAREFGLTLLREPDSLEPSTPASTWLVDASRLGADERSTFRVEAGRTGLDAVPCCYQSFDTFCRVRLRRVFPWTSLPRIPFNASQRSGTVQGKRWAQALEVVSPRAE